MHSTSGIDMISISEATELVNRRSPRPVKHDTMRSRLKKLDRKSGGRLLVDLSESGKTRKLWVRLDVLEEFFPRRGSEQDQGDEAEADHSEDDDIASAHRRIDQLVVRTTRQARDLREVRREQQKHAQVLRIAAEAQGANQRLAEAVAGLCFGHGNAEAMRF